MNETHKGGTKTGWNESGLKKERKKERKKMKVHLSESAFGKFSSKATAGCLSRRAAAGVLRVRVFFEREEPPPESTTCAASCYVMCAAAEAQQMGFISGRVSCLANCMMDSV